MRNLLFILLSFVVFSTTVQAVSTFEDAKSFQTARAVKIGRSSAKLSTNITNLSSSVSTETVGYNSPCDENCSDCNYATSTCSQCKDYYYLSETGCSSICTGVTCVSGTSAKEYATECCCE